MTDAIGYQLSLSLKNHINALWSGDVYDLSGNIVSVAFCPDELTETMDYEDSSGDLRVFGPCKVSIGRVQEDLMDMSGRLQVPSAFIEIYNSDPEQIENWRDSIYPSFDTAQGLDNQPLIMVGGATRFFRRMVVKMTAFFIDSDQTAEEVARLGNASSSFLEALTRSYTEMQKPWAWKMLDEEEHKIIDPFGERPWRSYPVISHSRRRGGPPNDYIWDIKVYVEVATFQE